MIKISIITRYYDFMDNLKIQIDESKKDQIKINFIMGLNVDYSLELSFFMFEKLKKIINNVKTDKFEIKLSHTTVNYVKENIARTIKSIDEIEKVIRCLKTPEEERDKLSLHIGIITNYVKYLAKLIENDIRKTREKSKSNHQS